MGFSQVDSAGLQQNRHILNLRFLAGSGRMSRERNAAIMRFRTLRSEKLSGSPSGRISRFAEFFVLLRDR